MANDRHPSRGQGFGTRGLGQRGASQAKPSTPRLPTYAELSKPLPDEEVEKPESLIVKIERWYAYQLEQSKWSFIICASLVTIGFLIYLTVGAFVSGAERRMIEGIRDAAREAAVTCNDPAARERLEQQGWTVRVGANGGCSIERRR